MNVWPATVRVPLRAAPVLAATVKLTVPFPLPLAPDVIVNHGTLLDAVHEHPAAVVTATGVPAPPDAPIDCDVGLIEKLHGAAAWLTVKVWPPIVTVPDRVPPVFAATFTLTEPLPLPLAPLAIVSHGALLVAVQVQPAAVDTATFTPFAPAAGTDWLVGLMLTVHDVPDDPAWLTVNVVPPILMLPMRPVVDEFAATLKPREAFPLPLAGDVSVIHGTRLLAVHGHPEAAVIATDPEPPADAIDVDVGCSVMVQLGGGGAGPAAGSWAIAMATLPTVTVPVRALPGFGATVKLTLPPPVPERRDRAIQLTSLDAVQAQPPGPEMVSAPVPPAAVKWFPDATTVS